ncbi:MAG: GHKL domain-containing protein [Lachnospiraceae bacterium]|nr:GHKL domain-containing protein [Lachnospiraceae bacterium]
MFLLSELSEITASILSFLLFFLFVNTICHKSAHFRYSTLSIAGAGLILISLISDTYIPNSVLSILGMLVEYFIVKHFYAIKSTTAILLVFIFNIWDIVSTNLVINLFLIAGKYSINSLFSPGTNERLLYLVTIYLVQYMFLYFFSKLYHRDAHLLGKRLGIALVFFFSDFLMVLFMHLILLSLSDVSHVIVNFCFFITFTMLIITIIGLFLLDLQYKEQQKEQEEKLLKLQIAEQQQAMQKMKKQYDSIRILKHDIKNILLNYRTLLTDNHVKEVIENINSILSSHIDSTAPVYSENSLLNALLNEMHKKCSQNSISLKCRLHLTDEYNDLPFMVLVSNLLDNAFEAELQEPIDNRLILLDLVEKENRISVVIQNYVSVPVLDTNPELYTSKESSELHGLGLKSVKAVIEERNGAIQIYETQNMFSVHVLFPKDK